jgi:arsenite methyltransferase
MTTSSPRTVLLLLALTLAQAGCGVNVLRVATSGRDGWQQPERVIAALDLKEGDRVAEIGAGSGYWIPWLSRAVGPTGRVYAEEVEVESVEQLRELVAREGLANVEVILGEYHDPLLPDGQIDLAITSLTYHHIEERSAFFTALHTDLSNHGRVAHLDDRPDMPVPFVWLQTDGHWSEPQAVRAEMAEAGYESVADFDFLFTQSFQIFAPVSAVAPVAAVSPGAGS